MNMTDYEFLNHELCLAADKIAALTEKNISLADQFDGALNTLEQQAAALQAKEDGLKVRDNHIAKLEAALAAAPSALMNALWPILGGNHLEVEMWHSIGEAVRAALENRDGE